MDPLKRFAVAVGKQFVERVKDCHRMSEVHFGSIEGRGHIVVRKWAPFNSK